MEYDRTQREVAYGLMGQAKVTLCADILFSRGWDEAKALLRGAGEG